MCACVQFIRCCRTNKLHTQRWRQTKRTSQKIQFSCVDKQKSRVIWKEFSGFIDLKICLRANQRPVFKKKNNKKNTYVWKRLQACFHLMLSSTTEWHFCWLWLNDWPIAGWNSPVHSDIQPHGVKDKVRSSPVQKLKNLRMVCWICS